MRRLSLFALVFLGCGTRLITVPSPLDGAQAESILDHLDREKSLVMSPSMKALADGVQTIPLIAFFLKDDGTPMPDIQAAFLVDAGECTINQPTTLSDAEGKVTGSISCTSIGKPTIRVVVEPSGALVLLRTTLTVEFEQGPPTALILETLAPPLVQSRFSAAIRLVDALNRIVTAATGTVTLSFADDPTGFATLSGTLTLPVVNGTALFDDLAINIVNDGYVLKAESNGFTATSQPFGVSPDAFFQSSVGIDALGYAFVKIDPRHPGVLYAAIQGVDLFRSQDAGTTWRAVRATDGSFINAGAYLFPQDSPDRVMISDATSILLSDDGGNTFARRPTPATNGVWSLISPDGAPDIIVAGLYSGMSISFDTGITWSPYGAGLPAGATVLALQDDGPRGVLWAVVGQDDATETFVYKSLDFGQNWTKPTQTSYPTHDTFRGWSVLDSGEIVMAFDIGLYRSTDAGLSFATAGTGLPSTGNEITRTSDGSLWMDTGWTTGLYKSTNKGVSFSHVVTMPAGIKLFAGIDPNTQALFTMSAITDPQYPGGIYRSEDLGATWQRASSGIRAARASRVTRDPAGSDARIVSAGGLLYRSADKGGKWTPQPSNRLLDGRVVWLPSGRLVTVAFNVGAAYSDDNGATWTTSTGLTDASGFEIVQGNGSLYIFASSGRKVFRSVDGAVWTAGTNALPQAGSAMLAADGANLYHSVISSTNVYVSRSQDNGNVWTPLKTFNNATTYQMRVISGRGANLDGLYVCAGKTVHRLTDAGTVEVAMPGMPLASACLDFDISDRAFLATTYVGLMAAPLTMPGAWRLVDRGLFTSGRLGYGYLDVDPSELNRVYFNSLGFSGVWQSIVGGLPP